ncbi:MAG TPA: putative metalloprotease CJM1_0395 family protein [Candidatus Competibacteraceae bacterium]|nr:hypothetical protein [Candidatus Competibacteraceae bacterium]MCP5133305.1 hypothetical protein [Gammaproteobacteria bacterium]HPF57282.1 putative metalloprotease CJM1_0395 family protein [Candidatus Competibacteraceae bacterium]HRY17903.1 putative metalloprotease CJM1_0395 family protein [Candidatus Competibacteraceae bacterium]
MIGGVHSSDYSYIPQVHASGSDSLRELQTNGNDSLLQGRDARSKNNPGTGKNQANAATPPQAKIQLTEAELAVVRELKQRDQKVRQHEMAHIMASGGLAQGGPSYTYQKGPDGKNYAIGGHVNLDISPGKTPEETLQKAQTIQAAATAPIDPSSQDRSIAAKASQMAMKARMELAQHQATGKNSLSQPGDDSPASRLARRFFSAVTPQPGSLIELTA